MPSKFSIDGPIPGENYTSDTKNYPWHRPPQHTDLDDAIEDCYKKLLSKDGSISVITMLQMGVSCVTIADMVVTSGIGAGKWTPDFALLMAGPVTHIIFMMGKAYGVPKMRLGLDDGFTAPTPGFFNKIKEIDEARTAKLNQMINLGMIQEEAQEQQAPEAPEEEQSEAPQGEGFMGMGG